MLIWYSHDVSPITINDILLKAISFWLIPRDQMMLNGRQKNIICYNENNKHKCNKYTNLFISKPHKEELRTF